MTIETRDEGVRLSDAELANIMALIRDADTVELKVTVPAEAHRATIQGLPMDPVEAQPRQVFFFDTPELALYEAGLVVRARRVQGGRGDTVIKLRPVVPTELPPALRREVGFGVEVDVLPGGYVCSASLKGRSTGEEIREVVRGKGALRRIFSKEQRALYQQHAPDGIELDSLVPLGPTFVLKTRFPIESSFSSASAPRLLVAELWLYPDGSRILELSTKCAPQEAFQVAMETRAYLGARGVPISAVQQPKTKTALAFYSAQLREGPVGAAPVGS